MLKGIDPLLGPELLAILRAMGHGDEIVIVDANFPAASNAQQLVRMDGIDAVRVLRAIAPVFPLDDFVPNAAFRMEVTDNPSEMPEVCQAFADVLQEHGYEADIEPIERMAFYARAREAYALVATGELRLWGNLILKKGAIAPEPR